MRLIDLTLRNVRRNFRLYTIYLYSMIAGVVIHFTFSSVMYNPDILAALRNRQNFETGVTIASVAVFLFIILFILYANSFFMRQRKKEFGMYLMYGMTERQITAMVFYETLTIGAVALVSGFLIGGLLSKLFGTLLMNLMQYDQAVSLAFPANAMGSTAAVFLLLTLIISAQSYLTVRRYQLVELFHAKEKMEKPVRYSAWSALLSVFLLGEAFVLIGSGRGSPVWQDYSTASLIACAVGIIGGTYLCFRQFTGWMLQRMSRRPGYYAGNTVLWTSALRFQMRGNTLNLSFISLFSTAIILLTCFVAINYTVQFRAVGMNVPNPIAFESKNPETKERVERILENSEHAIRYHRSLEAIPVQPGSALVVAFENPEYYFPEILLVSERSYNGIIELRGDDQQVQLQGNETVSLSQGMDFPTVYAQGEQPDITVKSAAGSDTPLRLVERKDYALLGWATDPEKSMVKKPAVLVVSDEFYESLSANGRDAAATYEIYGIENAKGAEELSKQVHALVTAEPETYYSSFADVYSKQIEGSSLLLFASAFLALIALFALAGVIYFKQLREATEAQPQYSILRKLGVDGREMKSVIRKQLSFVFVPPLVLGLLSSWLIIKSYILDTVQGFPNLFGIVWGIVAFYFLIYFAFYLSSTSVYYRIVSRSVSR